MKQQEDLSRDVKGTEATVTPRQWTQDRDGRLALGMKS